MPQTFSIAKANATINVTPYSVTYDGNAHTATGTAKGVNNEDLSGLDVSGTISDSIAKANATATAGSGSGTYNGSAQSPSACVVSGAYTAGLSCTNNPASAGPAVGTTTISPVVSGGVDNFNITLVNGSYTINAKQASATADNGGGVYNGSAYTGSGTCSDGLTPAITYTPGPGAPVNVGTTSFTVTCGDGGHSYINGTADGSITITKAPVTATAGSGSSTYDGLTHAPSACVVSGSYKGDLTCANNPASAGPAVGTTTITPVVSGTGLTNFAITLVNGSFTISKVPSVTAVSCLASVTYNGSAQTPCTATVTGAGGLNQTLTVSYTNNINVGTATASASFKAAVTATAGSGSAIYDGSIKSPSACTITGDYTGGLTCANSPASVGPGAGTTTIIPVVSGSGQTNFAITLVNGSFAISKADSVTTVSCPASMTYKGSAWTPCTATVTGAGGLNQTLTVSYTNNINAGTATASASFAGDANHNASSDSKTFQINKVTLTVTADNKTRVYGAANPTFTASYSGFVGGQTLATSGITGTPALSTTADANSPVGTYPIVAALGTLSSANYNFTFVNGTLTITQATLTITALNVSKTYGDVYTFSNSCPSINCTITGLAPNDSIAGVILTSPGAAAGTVVGTYPVTVTGFAFGSGSPSNYNVVSINGWLTILADAGQVAYIGQTLFVTSGASSTTAQVTLSASVWDITLGGGGTIGASTVTFTDLLSTLSTGQYGAQEYLIEVSLGGSYQNCLQTTNCQQTGATPGTPAYEAAHPVVTVMIPATKNTMQGSGVIPCIPTAAGTYGKVNGQCPADYPYVSYTAGFNYNNKGTNTQGKMELIIDRPDGTYYIKSNSVTSVAFTYLDSQGKPAPCVDLKACTDVTVYTKASIYKIVNGKAISIDGSVTFRMDAHDGRLTGDPDKLAFTVLSSKDGTLYYSNNWTFDSATLSYRTVLQDLQPSYTVDGKVISTVVQID
ncbi:MAG: hypothetical protein DMG17_04440 [Acidobacteria bacterium]|nr:MAG: hypothetical protein DMG17_04440 [Acidobacteriota bacterium]